MTTSNFSRSAKDANAVAICRGVPRWYQGKRLIELAPSRWLLNTHDEALFEAEYAKQLQALDPRQIYERLGENAVLLCWEKPNLKCHRRLVAEWLERELGIDCASTEC